VAASGVLVVSTLSKAASIAVWVRSYVMAPTVGTWSH
jgi:hypothetical protein